MYEFIHQAISETPFYYISVLNNSINQGAIPLCDHKRAQEYADISLSKTICVNNSYMLYSSKYDIDNIKKSFKSFGVDFIFSPFTLLERIFKDKIDMSAQLYVLIHEEYLTLAVFQSATLLFGSFELVDDGATDTVFDDKSHETEEITFDLDEEEDGISIDNLDALDDLSDLEDLDTISDLDDFADETVEIGEIESEVDDVEPSLESFGADYYCFLIIQKRLQEYYEDSRYENKFIETIYIADGNDSSEDLKRYLEEELFLNVIIRKTTLNDELIALSKDEVLNAL